MSADPPFHPSGDADQVLLVEDSEFFTKVVTRGIEERHGIKVISAKSMAEARVLIERHRSNFFLALLDLTLPDAPDGEIVNYVATRGIPAAIFSSRFNDDLRARVFAQTNVVDYILKNSPASIDYIVNMVGRLYRNRGIPVLVVDDSAVTRQKTFTLLTLQQFEVHSAANAKEALRLLDQNPGIRLVVTDFGMPGMNGVELTAAIRDKRSIDDIAIIGVSSTGPRQTSALFIKSGANDFLSEPFLPEEFLCRVSQNIELIDKIRDLKAAANTDFLTGLYNRRFFFEVGNIVFARARRAETPIAVAMVDIDFFKKINDAFGHDAGDKVLKRLAGIMRARPPYRHCRPHGRRRVLCLVRGCRSPPAARYTGIPARRYRRRRYRLRGPAFECDRQYRRLDPLRRFAQRHDRPRRRYALPRQTNGPQSTGHRSGRRRADAQPAAQPGRITLTRSPPSGRLASVIVPPWARIAERASASPSPTPPVSREREPSRR